MNPKWEKLMIMQVDGIIFIQFMINNGQLQMQRKCCDDVFLLASLMKCPDLCNCYSGIEIISWAVKVNESGKILNF